MKSFLYRTICGIVMGIGAVLPGVSGGILAISLGVYEKMMLAIGDFFKNIKANFRYLLPLVIGGGIGVLLTSNILSILINQYEVQLLSLFTGLVIGSIPELFAEVRLGGQKLRWKHLIAALLGLGFVLLFALGESNVAQNDEVASLTTPGALIAGLILSVGTVIPGISSSFILVYLGLYPAVITAIAGIMDLTTLATAGVGAMLLKLQDAIWPLFTLIGAFGLVSILIIRLVNRMLRRHHATSYAAIIGFVIGSTLLILPKIIDQFHWACPILFIAGLALSYLEVRMKAKLSDQQETSDAMPANDNVQMKTAGK